MKKVIIGVVVVFLMVGCGGGSSSTGSLPNFDNSMRGGNINQYGYFGSNIVFGEYTVSRSWTLYMGSESAILRLSGDGDMRLQIGSQFIYGDYGVSKDGRTIYSSHLNNISIKSVLTNYTEVMNIKGEIYSVDCYNVTGNTDNMIMCPV